jgi:squalene-hopene/tetraprenyl-beta-curcumene cyclase
MRSLTVFCLAVVLTFVSTSPVSAEGAVTLENVIAPSANIKDEPLAKKFSLEKAVHFLDSASINWQKKRKCFTCHTNYAFLYARPAVSSDTKSHATVRAFAEQLVTERWEKQGPRWDAEVVATAAALAFNDAATTGKLNAVTKTALDRMWTLQRKDGGFDWLKCNWPPMESDDHYGVTLAAIAVGSAPANYEQSKEGQVGLAKMSKYFKANPAPTAHHEAMLLWANSTLKSPVAKQDKQAAIKQLLGLQKADGGWGLATLGGDHWKRDDGKKQDLEISDGYGTGFVIFTLRQAGVDADNPQIQKGIAWLKSNQRESGRWFTRSLKKDGKHFISHAGTAFAIMAIQSCEDI